MVSALVGSNWFALSQTLNRLKGDFARKHGELSVETFDGEETELEQVQAALKSVSLFAPSKLVVVKSLSANKLASEQIEQLIESASGEAELLLVEPKPDKRSIYYKTLKKQAKVTEFGELDDRALVNWMCELAADRNIGLSRQDAQYLLNRVGNSQSRINNELQKLFAYANNIDRNAIDSLTEPIPQNTIFELLDAVFSGRTTEMLRLYDNLRQSGSQPPVILSMIVWQLTQVSLIAFAEARSTAEIAKDTGIKPYPMQKSQAIAARMGRYEIKNLFKELSALDYKLKTQNIDADEAVRNMLTKMTTS